MERIDGARAWLKGGGREKKGSKGLDGLLGLRCRTSKERGNTQKEAERPSGLPRRDEEVEMGRGMEKEGLQRIMPQKEKKKKVNLIFEKTCRGLRAEVSGCRLIIVEGLRSPKKWGRAGLAWILIRHNDKLATPESKANSPLLRPQCG